VPLFTLITEEQYLGWRERFGGGKEEVKEEKLG
jgi:hypothetical protein